MLPADHDSTRGDRATDRSLWRNRNFLKLWAGHTISMVGSQITPIALPLIASVTLQATPAQMALLTALDIFWNALYAVYFIYVTRQLGLLASAIGLIFSLGSVGALIGSLLVGRVIRRFGLGSTVICAQIAVGAGSLLIALAMWLPIIALPLLITAEFLQSCTGTIYAVNRDSLRQSLPPDRLRGRVNASASFRCKSRFLDGIL